VKLLLDNNISPRLVRRLSDPYPGTTHVRTVNLQSAPDERIWLGRRPADSSSWRRMTTSGSSPFFAGRRRRSFGSASGIAPPMRLSACYDHDTMTLRPSMAIPTRRFSYSPIPRSTLRTGRWPTWRYMTIKPRSRPPIHMAPDARPFLSGRIERATGAWLRDGSTT
jgi:hypothetical protein